MHVIPMYVRFLRKDLNNMISTLVMARPTSSGDVVMQLAISLLLLLLVVIAIYVLLRRTSNWSARLIWLGVTLITITALVYASTGLWQDLLKIDDDMSAFTSQFLPAIAILALLPIMLGSMQTYLSLFAPKKKD